MARKLTTEERRRQMAIALRFKEETESAPRVIAKGTGYVAQKILDLAREHNIPVREDPDLIASLMQLELNDVIPPELYPAVAEVLAYIYRMNQKQA